MKIADIFSVISAKQPVKSTILSDNTDVKHLLTDSRLLALDAPQTLFFAIKTDKNDGINYVENLYKKGVRCFIVSDHDTQKLTVISGLKGINLLVVADVLQALQDLAIFHRSQFHCPVIGITGSHGKTIVKEWLYQLLKDDYVITCSPKSYNSQIGVPLSVWQMNERTQLAIFEAGISEKGEMAKLQKIIQPTIGVLTYIGKEHNEQFASLEEKRAEKMKLFAQSEVVLEDSTHQNIRTCGLVLRHLGYDPDVIAHKLSHQTHETILEVNLEALVNNVRYFRSLLEPTTKMVCMVKAFAYGTGCVDVSKALQQSKVADYLAVAVADEGVELRQVGITLPIIVMDFEMVALDSIIENNLEPNIYSFDELRLIRDELNKRGVEQFPIHIKIDSGMHRLGFYKEDMDELASILAGQNTVRVISIFSHLAGSDDQQFDDFTHQQIRYFTECADSLAQKLPYPFMRHILNSAGIERFTESQMDMCRLGIGMYGFSFNNAVLQNVCSLKTVIIALKTVKAHETIGYSRRTKLTSDRLIAVIPIGYADGLDRRLSNYNGSVIVRGKKCPIVGNICMDQAMVDVTDTDAQVGDRVVLFDDVQSINALAEQLGTIPYEIITSISRRVKRVYANGSF